MKSAIQILFLLTCVWLPVMGQNVPAALTVRTLAGRQGWGSRDGVGTGALFYSPRGLVLDSNNNLYVADSGNSIIRKITPGGVVTTIAGLSGSAGSADGSNSDARFDTPTGIAIDTANNLYVSDTRNHTIRKITPAGTNWVVTTIAGLAGVIGTADGTNSDARFNWPWGITADSSGKLFLADSVNHTIRQLCQAGPDWVVTTLAGSPGTSGSSDGTNSAALFNNPVFIALDLSSNLYVTDSGNSTVRKITASESNWVVTTIAGLAGNYGSADGTNTDARFYGPEGIAVDLAGNLYVADYWNSTVRGITPSGAVVTVAGVAGSADYRTGTGDKVRFGNPFGVIADAWGNVLIADSGNIRIASPASPLAVAPVSRTDTSIRIRSFVPWTYRLQVCSSLAPSNWVDSGEPQSGTGGDLVFIDSGRETNGPGRFYRIKLGGP